MNVINFLAIILILFLTDVDGQGSFEKKLTEIVNITKGSVRGEIVKSVQNSVEYSAFRAIPYAKPPIDQLRFKPPIEVDAWTDVMHATKEATMCPQLNRIDKKFYGNEDCLYLNVYTPKTEFHVSHDELLAVMVWIHGGGFLEGTIDSRMYGPDFLIENNVILVDMAYRLGALGFLALGHPDATGNAGLKDQVLALKWVRDNIQKFGGDPMKVTIIGQSAGSASVFLHQVSDASKGLFNAIIAMSGSPLNHWGFSSRERGISRAFRLGANLGIITLSKKNLLKKLHQATPEELVRASTKITSTDLPFKPTFEDKSIATDVFLSECVIKRLKSGNYAKVPVILGFVRYEAIGHVDLISKKLTNVEHLSISPNISMDIADIYDTQDPEEMISDELIHMTSALLYGVGIDRTQQYLAESSMPIYYYRNSFDYDASLHRLMGIEMNGTAHGDDLFHIFWLHNNRQSLDPRSDISIHRTKMTKMWTNFAKYFNPTPNGTADTLLNVAWTPSGTEGVHLAIGQTTLMMGPRPVDNFVKTIQISNKPFEARLNGCPLLCC